MLLLQSMLSQAHHKISKTMEILEEVTCLLWTAQVLSPSATISGQELNIRPKVLAWPDSRIFYLTLAHLKLVHI